MFFDPLDALSGGDAYIERLTPQPLQILARYVPDDCVMLLFESYGGVDGRQSFQQMRGHL